MLEHKIRGSKSALVLFENGMGSTYETWQQIPDTLAKLATVITYNRAGLGKSEPTTTLRSIPNMVSELENLLQSQHLDQPVLLVAHSMGSYVSRYFALQHPDKVIGMVLVDPSPDTMYDAYSKAEMQAFINFGDTNYKNASAAVRAEWQHYLKNRKYVQKPLSNTFPVIVLSATQWDFYKYHKSILNKHPKSKHLKVTGGHDLHHEKPELIVEIIESLLPKSGRK